MKKKTLIFMGMFVAMLTTFFVSCNNDHSYEYEWPEEDSLIVKDIVENAVNPSFTTSEEVVRYQKEFKDSEEEKVIFLSMTEHMVEQVSRVALSRSKTGSVNMHDIVVEYLHGQDIYDRLVTQKEEICGTDIPIPELLTTDTVHTTNHNSEQ